MLIPLLLRLPDLMSDEQLQLPNDRPRYLNARCVTLFDQVHDPPHILNQDVIAGDNNSTIAEDRDATS